MQIFTETQKWCNTCKQYKDFADFYKSKNKINGVASNCKVCSQNAKRTESYREGESKRRKSKYRNNDSFREEVLRKRAIYRAGKIREVMLCQAKIRSRRNKLNFNLELDDIDIPEYCPILNIKMTQGPRNLFNSPSLDRIDVTKGYIKGNVAVISILANMMKNKATLDQLKLFCKNIPIYISKVENS
jgi:hypothetical protein